MLMLDLVLSRSSISWGLRSWGFDRFELIMFIIQKVPGSIQRTHDRFMKETLGTLLRVSMLHLVSTRNNISLELQSWGFDGIELSFMSIVREGPLVDLKAPEQLYKGNPPPRFARRRGWGWWLMVYGLWLMALILKNSLLGGATWSPPSRWFRGFTPHRTSKNQYFRSLDL